jgi:hypothetical protein
LIRLKSPALDFQAENLVADLHNTSNKVDKNATATVSAARIAFSSHLFRAPTTKAAPKKVPTVPETKLKKSKDKAALHLVKVKKALATKKVRIDLRLLK